MSDNDDDLSSAIRNFITGQHATPHPPTPPQQPEPEPEPEPEPQPVPPPRPAPRHQENIQIMFVYDGEEIQFSEVDATPTAVADHFELDREDIYLQRNDRTFHVHATEDRFKTSLRPGRRYTVLKRETPTRTTPRRQTEQNSRECTLIANGQRKAIPAGTVRRALIATTFGLGRNVEDIKLIGYDGTVINNRQQYELNPGATYHVVYTDQKALELAKDDEHEESIEPFSKAMSLMAPFMVAVVRSLYAMSFTGEKVTFTNTNQTNNDPSKPTSKLLCSNKLSTGAYQVTYRFNTAFKAIRSLTKILSINFENDDVSLDVFSHSEEAEALCNSLSHAINLLEKAHAELEELLNIVVTEMRIANPSVESVRISLKIETNQEKRTLEKEETKKIDKTLFDEKCDKIFLNDEEIRPPIVDLYTISNNRKHLNDVTELVEKVLADLDDTVALEDVTNLLDFCAKISHKNLMHWIFAYNVFETLRKDTDDAEKTTVGYRRKRNIGNRIYDVLQLWKTVSRGVSLAVNMNEESEDVHELWSKLKNTIITAQYALEVRHQEQIYFNNM